MPRILFGDIEGKLDVLRVECKKLLLELVPAATSIAYLRNPTNPIYAEAETREVQTAASTLGVRLLFVNASRPIEIDCSAAGWRAPGEQ